MNEEVLTKLKAILGEDATEENFLSLIEARIKAQADSLAALKKQLDDLKKDDSPSEEMLELLEQSAENVDTQLEALAASGRITPKVRDDLRKVLCGETGSRPAVFLSRKSGGIARRIVDALKNNDPVELHKTALTGAQVLSRPVQVKTDDPDLTKEMVGVAYGS